ncbi:FKBP-type peptidyl-prolyl cis-trans isomerase [Streptomyces sp. V1I1]|uniref:FKBP-type peptidyl-prolyl cis-trans isomerase n=1 Tax=Streptomyces sp. V1I1 TaxID=3042272 RepID=UPI0027884C2C|nr:FKBP-type peptidyl-prolyl cis-trans isomerase [Streptomyces sp. V1I1]MDQ0938412.1 FKBP-type peptidyl-prolyl cis-trans isomerase [Streptomyces sp. V1I1]
MRRIAMLLTASVLVTGCSGEKSSSAAPDGHRALAVPTVSAPRQAVPAAVATDTTLPKVSGEFGRRAALTIPKEKPSGKFVVTSLLQGHGPRIGDNDVVVVDYTAKTWKSGTDLPGTYNEGQGPKVFPVGRGAVIPALDRAVRGQQAGSRVLVVAPPAAAYGASGNAGLKVAGTDTVVFVIDIKKVIGAKSTVRGQQQEVPDTLPQVHADRSGVTLAIPGTGAPKRLESRSLVEGSGRRIAAGDTVVLRHAGAVWGANRGEEQATLFDSSWLQGPGVAVVGRGNLIKGLDQALVGAEVGSRMLLVVPPELAYGSQAQKDIPARSTLVFVVDILAAE